jgi:hypothetical protein
VRKKVKMLRRLREPFDGRIIVFEKVDWGVQVRDIIEPRQQHERSKRREHILEMSTEKEYERLQMNSELNNVEPESKS